MPDDKHEVDAGGEAPSKERKTMSGGQGDQDPVEMRIASDVNVVVEGEVFPMHSQVLALSSPMFAGLLRSQMAEGLTKEISLEGKSKDEFRMFAAFLQPGPVGGRTAALNGENVDRLLPWFDEYQITSLKEESHQLLLTLPFSYQRLADSHMFGLDAQYKRCLAEACPDSFHKNVASVAQHEEVLRDVLTVLAQKNSAFQKLYAVFCKYSALPAEQRNHILTAMLDVGVVESGKAKEQLKCLAEVFYRATPSTVSFQGERLDAHIRDQLEAVAATL